MLLICVLFLQKEMSTIDKSIHEQRDDFFQIMHRMGKIKIADIFDNMTKMEFITLCQIEERSKNSQKVKISDIAKCTQTHFSAVSRTINGLEQRGLVVRINDSEDRRTTYVEMTQLGRQQLAECQGVLDDFLFAVFERVGANDVSELKRIMSRIYDVTVEELNKRK